MENQSATPAPAPSLRGRIAAAVALTLGYYALAIGLALLLIAGPIALWAAVGHGNIWVVVALAGAGFTVLRSLGPIRDAKDSELPGIEVGRDVADGLLHECQAVAQAVGQSNVDSCRLTLEVNAGVIELGAGVRSAGHRVLLVGLPLLSILSVSEMRAVIAHEFGHYVGADTRIGPWIYRIRERISRTIVALSNEERLSHRIARSPFLLYGRLFMRVTNAISRRQEFAADAVAVSIAGASAQRAALRKIHGAGPAYDSFWANELSPLLHDGKRPPVLDGFRQFLNADGASEAVERLVAEQTEARTHPYDSHPSLGERLAAIPEDGQAEDDSSPALALVNDPERLEEELLRVLVGSEFAKLEPTDWATGVAELVERSYRGLVEDNPHLAKLEMADLSNATADPLSVGRGVKGVDGDAPDEHARAVGMHALGAALAVRLLDEGYRIESGPGLPVRLVRNGSEVIDPFELVRSLADEDADDREALHATA